MKTLCHPIALRCLLALLLMLQAPLAWGQDAPADSGQQTRTGLQLGGSLQFWLRHTSLNPGSLVDGEPAASSLDLSIRRYRLRLSGTAGEQLRYTLELGNNDVSHATAAASLPRLLDAYVDYQLSSKLAFGAGKQAWAGPARYAAPATTQALAYDIDFVAAPFVNVYDDILRRM
ncbi:porin, partial [Cesiribacter andamanensis]|uniref:porin n=1 Tax=Cesiribacter andamanensis TaxID=649507 RepID=UPI00058E3BB7